MSSTPKKKPAQDQKQTVTFYLDAKIVPGTLQTLTKMKRLLKEINAELRTMRAGIKAVRQTKLSKAKG